MATIHTEGPPTAAGSRRVVFVKGAPDRYSLQTDGQKPVQQTHASQVCHIDSNVPILSPCTKLAPKRQGVVAGGNLPHIFML